MLELRSIYVYIFTSHRDICCQKSTLSFIADTSISSFEKKRKEKERKKNGLNRTYLLKARSNRIDVGHTTGKERRKTFYLAFHRKSRTTKMVHRCQEIDQGGIMGLERTWQLTDARLPFLVMKISLDTSFQGDEHVFTCIADSFQSK